MFTLVLSEEEFKALWETLFEKEKNDSSKNKTDTGFESLQDKVRQGPLYAVETKNASRERRS